LLIATNQDITHKKIGTLVRKANKIKSILYITMTVAILLQQYKKDRKLKGYKIAKQKFSQDLERDIIYHIVVLCGGSVQRAKQVLFQNSS